MFNLVFVNKYNQRASPCRGVFQEFSSNFQVFKLGSFLQFQIIQTLHPTRSIFIMVSKSCKKRICKYSFLAAALIVAIVVYMKVIKPIQDGTSSVQNFLPDLNNLGNFSTTALGDWAKVADETMPKPENTQLSTTKAEIEALLASIEQYKSTIPGSVVKTVQNMAKDHPTSRV